jgi:fructose-1,6-bisphosphatase II
MVSLETGSLFLHPDRNLALELVRATEAAAIRAVPFIGRGDKNAADKAAVDAMRKFLGTVNFAGTIVIGEGEKDRAPMLFNGEVVGNGHGPECDIAVDPIDGTSLTAAGRQNAISMIAAADRGAMLDAHTVFYMNKIVAGPEGVGVVDIRKPVGENIRALAKAGTRLLLDGDVAGGINAASYEGRLDMCVGIGGSPEGVATACAIKALGGVIQTVLAPKTDDEIQKGRDAGLQFDHVYEADELVKGDNTFFVATGVTDGQLVSGVRRKGPVIRTESIVLRARSGTIRRIIADHQAEKWLDENFDPPRTRPLRSECSLT